MSSRWGRTGALALAVAAMTVGAVFPAAAGPGPSPAPGFTLEGLDGKPVSLAAYKGSPVILLFWAPW
jgi:cytochrome oxidase Cu insertion factor (SCO1/SenC/PrrC family)